MYKCFLDSDGVLADFVAGACKLHKFDQDLLMMRWKPGPQGFDFNDLMGLSNTQFYKPMNQSFWAGLPPTKECFEIVAMAEKAYGPENVCILTKPTLNAESYSGKYEWVEKHLPLYTRRLLVGACKEFCAGSNRVLVDDKDENIAKFIENGGKGVIVPRHWNSFHTLKDSVLNYLRVHLPEKGMSRIY